MTPLEIKISIWKSGKLETLRQSGFIRRLASTFQFSYIIFFTSLSRLILFLLWINTYHQETYILGYISTVREIQLFKKNRKRLSFSSETTSPLGKPAVMFSSHTPSSASTHTISGHLRSIRWKPVSIAGRRITPFACPIGLSLEYAFIHGACIGLH